MASAYPPHSFVTRTTTVRTARMRPPAPNPLAAEVPSSATTRCVCRPSGSAMETRIVPMGLTSGRRTAGDSPPRRLLAAAPTISSVQMGSAFTAAGGVTEAWTVRTNRMKPTAVSWLSWCLFFILFYLNKQEITISFTISVTHHFHYRPDYL